MTTVAGRAYREVWLVDFEFNGAPGDLVSPVCLVAHETSSGRTLRLWADEFVHLAVPPYANDADALVVAYYASAELGCHLALGWPLPANVLDLFTEFRTFTNGTQLAAGGGLLGALAWYGLSGIAGEEKDAMRELVLSGGPWDANQRHAILDYCESDVVALAKLLPAMAASIDLPRALLRGRSMKAAARIEAVGVPIDLPMLNLLRMRWDAIQVGLIASVDADYGVYEGGSFREHRFAAYLADRGIGWPTHESGRLQLDDDTFKDMAKVCPEVQPLRELRVTLGQMRLSELAVGTDGRNRCLLSAFRARTGRNQLSNTKFIFGPAVWLRGLIRPGPGWGIAYVDWSQQEFGIAAALSGDQKMQEAYTSGDPYLAFAKQAGAAPPDATKRTHGAIREQFKACVLAVQYGMGPESLAQRIGQPVYVARDLLQLHRRTYPTFWKWSDAALDHANLHGRLHTVFGWQIQVGSDANPRSLRNFPMQANGAEMLRLACCLLTEHGIRVCAPVHDALLIEAPLDELDAAIAATQELMAQASKVVLGGFRLRSDAKAVRYPDRYMDERGAKMWDKVMDLVGEPLAACQR
jgi:DNA polymerase I